MASFKDRKGDEWVIQLDAPTIDEIRTDHSVNLATLDHDPIGPLRNDPMKLVTVVSVVCREQITERSLSPVQFAKLLPSPPDPMLDAVREAVIGFFPSGRASHIREVLAKFDQMAMKTDELASIKMQAIIDDPGVMDAINKKADKVISQEIQKMVREAGTPSIADTTSST